VALASTQPAAAGAEANTVASAAVAGAASADAVMAADSKPPSKAAPPVAGRPKLTPPQPKPPKKRAKRKRPPYVGGDVMFNRAMDVRGMVAAGSLMAQNASVLGTLIARQIKTKHIRSHTMSVGELKTTRLSSPTGTIVIEGDLLITHSRALEFGAATNSTGQNTKSKGKKSRDTKKTAKGMSFLAESVVVGGVKQWALIRQDHFQSDSDGWRLVGSNEPVGTSSCPRAHGSDRFLGGHCILANGPARKIYTHLPPHTQIRLTARYHFIDNWRGETAFAQIDSAYVWTQTHRIADVSAGTAAPAAPTVGIDLCGSDRYPESRLSSPIDVSVGHDSDSIAIAFGAHSAASGTARSMADERAAACERSFGVDDVALYIR